MTEQKSKPSANPNAISAQKLKEVIENPKKDIDLFYALSKAKLLFWARLVDPTFRWPKHIRYVADRLERVHTRKNQRLIIELPPRHGKACADNQYVPTLSGWKKHGDLKVGDYVFGGDGKPVRITAVSAPVMVDCEIGFMDGTSIVVHENHEWLIHERGIGPRSKRKDSPVRVVETKYIAGRKLLSGAVKKRCVLQLPMRPRLKTPSWDLPMDPYVFGAWLGDGSSSKPCITCCPEDSLFIINEIRRRGHEISGINEHKGTGVLSIYYSSGKIGPEAGKFQKELQECGAWKNKHIPEIYKFASIEQRLDLLAGLIDTDGSVGKDRRVRVVTASKRLACDIVDIIHSLGWRAGVNVQKPVLSSSGIQGKKDIYYVGFTPDGDIPTVLPRKKISGFPKSQRAIGFKYVRKCKPVRGRCIEVEGGLYVVGRGMHVTHNSTLSTKVFPAWYLGNNPDKRVITASSTTNLATSFSRYTRNIFREFAPKVFGHSIASDSKGSARWDISGHQGGLLAAGVGKQISGFGADCVAEGTMIATEAGDIAVEHLVRLSVKPRVWSFNHQTGEAELKNVIATRETEATELYSVGTSDGRKIEVTGRHRIFDRQRQEYRKAEVLSQGTGLIAISDKNQKAMSDVREGEAFPVKIMQKMLSRGHVGPDSISSLERRSCKPVKVYDIQVEGNSNFFAGEILVHNCLIIDDAVRNAEEAYSQTSRDKVWTWYVNDARTRLHSGGSIILVGTRWHEDDIIGRALDDEDEKWERIRLPALSEGDGDLLGREEGKALWPAMFDLDYFRAPMKETNVWSALYQQNPVPIGGGIIKRDWIKYYDALPEASTSYLQSWDMTFKKTNNGSYVVGQVWCRDKANFYLVDQVRKRCNFADTLESVKIMISKWPKCNRILVEDKANGPAIISMLRKDIPGVLAIKADVSKEARLRSVEPYFEAGNVFFPSPDTHAWVKELVAEVTSFPSCKYDDQVDAMSQALSKYRDDYATMPTDADLSFGRRQSPWRM